jgi:ribosome-associated protein
MSENRVALESDESQRDDAVSESRADIYQLDDDGPDTEALAREIVRVTWDLKGRNSVALDLRGLVSYTDFAVICTGQSERHVRALAQQLQEALHDANWETISLEGLESGEWAILDVGDVVIHLFEQSEREAYDLESMWPESEPLEFSEHPEELYGHFEVERFD